MQSVSRNTAVNALGEDRRGLAQLVVDRVFDSIRLMQVSSGMVQEFSSPDQWRHRKSQDVEADLTYLEIHRPAILTALSDYLADRSLHTREIDWLFLNLLTYAEYVATVAEIRKKLLGVSKYFWRLHAPYGDHTPSISGVALRPWHAALAAGAIAVSFFIHPILAVGMFAVSVYWYLKRKKAIVEVDALLSAMLRTYASFNTVDLSWSHVARTLEDSRREGAIWDASLFKLVEARQSAA